MPKDVFTSTKWLKFFSGSVKNLFIFASLFLAIGLLYKSVIFAATSPWIQTDWSGDSGQTSWFDNTKFNLDSNIDSSTPGYVTLSKQSELFSNTGFESDLSNWSEVATYSNEVLNTQTANIVGYWQLNETSGSLAEDSSSQGNDGSYSGVTLDSDTGPDNQPVGYWDSTTSYANIYSSDLNTDFNGAEGGISLWFKAADESMWTENKHFFLVNFTSDTGDFIFIRKQNNSQYLMFGYRSGGVEKYHQAVISNKTSWNHIAFTWSDSADQLKVYVNGTNVNTATGLGTWGGNLTSTQSVIGSNNTTPSYPWKGNIAHVGVWNTPLSQPEVTSLSSAMNITSTRDTTTTYSSSAGSAKLVSTDAGIFAQSVNVADTNTYVLEGYVYTDGNEVTSSDLELYYNNSTISTTFSHVGSNWYKMLGTLTGANENRNYGVQVKSGKTLYIDNMSLSRGYHTSGTLTSSIFDAESQTGWGNLTFTTDGIQTSTVKIRTSNDSSMNGATDFSSCSAITSGSDISSNSCVSDDHRYIQYQVGLSTSDITQAPSFQDISIAFTEGEHTAKTYYVDATSGSDSSSGTSTSSPWQTISNVNTAIDSGVIQAGDTVYFKRGETFSGSLDVDVSGSSGNVITFGAYGSGNKPIIDATGNASAIDLTGRSYITIDNLNLKNATTQAVYFYNDGSNITVTNTDVDNTTSAFHINTGAFSNVTIQTSTVTNSSYGLQIASTTSVSDLTVDEMTANSGTNGVLIADSGTFENVTISNSTFSQHSGRGVSISGTHTNLTLDSVVANSNGGDGLLISSGAGTISNLTVSDGTYNSNVGTGLILYGTGSPANITNTEASSNQWDGFSLKDNWTGVVYDGCTANSNGVDGIGGDGDGFTGHENNEATIKNSIARNNKQGNVSYVGNSSATIEYNEFTLETATVHGSVWVTGTGDFWIYNNVIYNALQNGSGIEIGGAEVRNVTIKNNVVYGFNYGIFQDTPYASVVTEDYNIAYNYGTKGWHGLSVGDHDIRGSNSFSEDPIFTDSGSLDFTLQSNSPAIDTGTDVSLTTDILGTSVPQGDNPDIGAYEYDDTLPTISNTTISVSSSEATITWTTSEAASSIIDYGLTSSYGTTTTETDTSPRVTSHSVTLSSLSTCTTYHYRIRSNDAAGNEASSSDKTFTTDGCPESNNQNNSNNSTNSSPSAPTCTDIRPVGQPDLFQIDRTGNQAKLYFTPVNDHVESYHVIFGFHDGDERFGGINMPAMNENEGVQSIIVDNLDPKATYSFKVVSVNGCAAGEWSNWLKAGSRQAQTSIFYRYWEKVRNIFR